MYSDHVPTIASAMRASPEVFARGIMFAVLSARVQFHRVPADLADLERDRGECRALWGWKLDAWRYAEEHKGQLWRDICAAPDDATALYLVTRIPGVGLVKGAFVLQLLGHDVACLDVRNIVTDGRKPRAYRADGEARKHGPAFNRKLQRYLDDVSGRARFYWDRWCYEVAASYGLTPDECSALHLSIVPRGFRLPRGANEPKNVLPNTGQSCPF